MTCCSNLVLKSNFAVNFAMIYVSMGNSDSDVLLSNDLDERKLLAQDCASEWPARDFALSSCQCKVSVLDRFLVLCQTDHTPLLLKQQPIARGKVQQLSNEPNSNCLCVCLTVTGIYQKRNRCQERLPRRRLTCRFLLQAFMANYSTTGWQEIK